MRARCEVHLRGADRILFDTRVGNTSGGTGRSFSWALLDGLAEKSEALLAGGIRAENARRARGVGTWGIDVSSGVERVPGEKDPDKIRKFFDVLRAPSRGDDDAE